MKRARLGISRTGKALLLACLLTCTSACTTADLGGTSTGTGTGNGTAAATTVEKSFVTSAASGLQLRLKLSEAAVQKSANLEVTEFAKLMVSQHGKTIGELKGIAQQLRVTYPAALSSSHQGVYDRVMKLTGADFDRSFAREMELAYQQDIALYQSGASTASHLALRGYILKTNPIMQAHLRLATQLKNILP